MARGLCELVGRLKYWDQQRALTEEPVDPEWLHYLAGIIPAMEVSSAFASYQIYLKINVLVHDLGTVDVHNNTVVIHSYK